ncbi:hypothetical protein [Streptomyces galbus]|uniref:Uncharacterized protein n=1 Tax=Streptomyces galbus TaxID=33898 RepID=A0ABX1IFE4_STRGB|nr:hypothetical protein [Streptomyces galbus]NKQ23196.1 hypothetical protein [Streptomyces galbus]
MEPLPVDEDGTTPDEQGIARARHLAWRRTRSGHRRRPGHDGPERLTAKLTVYERLGRTHVTYLAPKDFRNH